MTKTEAKALFESSFWEEMTLRQRAEFQMHEPLLCMPFSVFHEAVEKTLGRPVFTHEFGLAHEELKAELRGDRGAPTLEQIIEMIPAEKRILVALNDGDGS